MVFPHSDFDMVPEDDLLSSWVSEEDFAEIKADMRSSLDYVLGQFFSKPVNPVMTYIYEDLDRGFIASLRPYDSAKKMRLALNLPHAVILENGESKNISYETILELP
jgi:hypothetical protein